MFFISSIFWVLGALGSALDNPNYIQESIQRCTPQESEDWVYSNDFKWGYTLLEMQDRFLTLYSSSKRLRYRVNYDAQQKSFVIYHGTTTMIPVAIPESFIRNVTTQIETAIQRSYANYVFFPDMGHSHLHIPEEVWDSEYKELSNNQPQFYQKVFSDSRTQVLYHLAEQLKAKDDNDKILDDPNIQWIYWNRNYLVLNDESGSHSNPINTSTSYNTVSSVPGHHSWSQGFALHASKNGCFSYRDANGVIRYYDIAIYDPQPDPKIPIEDY